MWQPYRAIEVLDEQGPVELAERSIRYIIDRAGKSSYVPFIENIPYHKRRIDNEYRWSFIKPYIEEEKTCIDLGCAEGYFTAKAADEDLLALGIEADGKRLSNAQKRWGYRPNIGYARWEITPENIEELPTTDVIFLLTIYHHFVEYFGKEDAKYMLESVGKKADKLVCEMPGEIRVGCSLTVKAVNTETGEEHEFSPEAQGGSSIRPKFHNQIPPGTYKITIHTQENKSSNSEIVTVGKSGRLLGEKPRIKFEGGEIKLIPGEEDTLEIDDMIEWYNNLFYEVFGDSIEILDRTLTDYSGGKRKDILYIIDTSNIEK